VELEPLIWDLGQRAPRPQRTTDPWVPRVSASTHPGPTCQALASTRPPTRSNPGHWSRIWWLAGPDTPSRGVFVQETLNFLRFNPSSLVFARRPLWFFIKAPNLLVYRRIRPSFVFWIPKLVYFISFAYELRIKWFKLQNIHKIILYLFKL
jgi:hypothetical protein